MNRSLRTVGIAAIAVLVVSAFAASTAGASSFTASQYPTGATASSEKGNDDLKTEAGSVECKASFLVMTMTAPSETIEVSPTYTECKAFGFLSATVAMNLCSYIFHSNGEVDVACPGKEKIVIVASTCEAIIESQNGLKSIALSNSGTGISAKANVGGIAYEVTKDGFACPFGGKGKKTGATYTQNNAIQISSTNGATIDVG